MSALFRVGSSALFALILLYFGPQLLAYPLALLPGALYAALPIDPFGLNLVLSSLLAGVCLALLTPVRRLASSGLVVLGLLAVYSIGFYSSLCSSNETQRVHAELAAMPLYNLGQPLEEQPLQFDSSTQLSYACILPEARWDSIRSMTGDFLLRLLALFVGVLLIPRRSARRQPLAT